MFLVNSRLGIILCGPAPAYAGKGLTLLLTYGRFFAEFLEDLSLVRLGLLALNTCVGLRYGLQCTNLEVFLGSVLTQIRFDESPLSSSTLTYRTDLPIRHNH